MKRTLDEHIKRIKQLSLISENDNANKENTIEKITDTPEFEAKIEDAMNSLLDKISNDFNQLGNKVGDRDGTLEVQGESLEINESGLAILGGTVLAAPKIIDMIGKGTRQLGIKVNSNMIKNAGEAATNAGKKLHNLYFNTILNLLKKLPRYKNMSDENQKKIAKGVLLAATVAAGLSALNGISSALSAGDIGTAAIETGLGSVKALEIGEIAVAARTILPNIMNGMFN